MRLVPLRAAVASVFHSENFINKRNAEWERNKMHLVHDGSLVWVFQAVSLIVGEGGGVDEFRCLWSKMKGERAWGALQCHRTS